ncbi:hypothetical protein PQQ86_38295 [Paraburkholderia sediminicola]|uniref:hypothetical protein n=1 Tax=Paraburkholderia sediminicola TaxID=458836 RepID=UPI0038BB600B
MLRVLDSSLGNGLHWRRRPDDRETSGVERGSSRSPCVVWTSGNLKDNVSRKRAGFAGETRLVSAFFVYSRPVTELATEFVLIET